MKKGFIFTLDALFAVLILMGSIVFILSHLSRPQPDYYIDRMPTDIIGVLSYTRTTDLCSLGANSSTCTCPNYPKLKLLACSDLVRNRNETILELYSEVISTSLLPNAMVEQSVHEIFVEKHVIDENRFGFSLLFTSPAKPPLELYNTETYP